MFTGFTDETIQFFLDLRFHNHADFFHANHDRYVETVQKPFYRLIDVLAGTALDIDPQMEVRPHRCLSRIHRDTRFSKDKSPYRDHLWFLFRKSAEPREKSLFFYGEFGPGRLDWGMGIWGENRELMDAFRRKTAAFPDRMSALISGLRLPERGMSLGGDAFRRFPVPEQVPPELHRWYRAKNMYVGKDAPEFSAAFSEKLADEMRTDFLALAPLYRVFRGLRDELESSGNQGENK